MTTASKPSSVKKRDTHGEVGPTSMKTRQRSSASSAPRRPALVEGITISSMTPLRRSTHARDLRTPSSSPITVSLVMVVPHDSEVVAFPFMVSLLFELATQDNSSMQTERYCAGG